VIWVWINATVRWLSWFFIPAPGGIIIPKIDPNAPCPNCGHTDGKIRAIVVAGRPKVEHICNVCAAHWNDNPVVDTSNILPAETPKE